jgi:ribulose-phosphate 3-epimerase
MPLSVYPSLISADLLNLAATIEKLNPYCPGYHLDIMDNHFVPNLTWGPAFIDAITAAAPHKTMWAHLMVENPETWIPLLHLPVDSIVSIHIESLKNVKDIINNIREKKWRASLAISPKTPIQDISPLLPHIDQVLVMSVVPGLSGQKFLPQTWQRLDTLIQERQNQNLSFSIGIDGGVTQENIAQLGRNGVQDFAAAASIFHQPDMVAALQKLNALISR